MFYILFSLFGILTSRGKGSISKALFALLLCTSLAAYLVGRQQTLFDFQAIVISLFTAILLYFLFISFKDFSNCKGIDYTFLNERRLASLEWGLKYVAIVIVVINLYVLYKIFPLLIAGLINVQEYKNEGGAAEIIDSYVPHIFITFSNIFSAVGYFFLSMHFFHLVRGETKKSIVCFLLSLTIILSRMIALSRSSSIEYLITYLLIFLFIKHLLSKKMKRRFLIVGSVIFFIIMTVLGVISSSRFSDSFTKTSESKAIIDEANNPIAFSVFDYMSQWVELNYNVQKNHEFGDLSWGAYGFSELPVVVLSKVSSYDDSKRVDVLKKKLGDDYSGFPGLIASLVVDFGFIGAFLFIILLSRYIKKSLSPRYGKLSIKTILWLPIIINVVGLFWAGNFFSSLAIEFAIVYTLLIQRFLIGGKTNCTTTLAIVE